jgi:hypothetical protein
MSPQSPSRTWKPTQRQADFISLPDAIFEALFGGAAGGGKTETLLMLPVVKKTKSNTPLYEHPRFKMLYLRRTFPELDREVIPRSQEFYPACGFNPYQDQKKRWTHPSGAIIQFGHCENEKDVRKYDTSEYNIICFDEATSFTPNQYEYLTFSRCRTSSIDLPAIVRAGTNPGNIGHGYFRDRFVKPAKDGNIVLRETRPKIGTILRIFIPSKASDNIHLMQADPDYVNRMNRLPPAERAAKADGDWWSFEGQVFSEWRVEPFPGEPDFARHIIKPFTIPSYWPRLLSIDWGYSAMTVAGRYAINPQPCQKYPAKIYKEWEYSCKKTKISTWASDIRRLNQGIEFVDIVLDPSAWGDRGDEYTIAEQFERASGYKARRADNGRISGKLLIHDLLRWTPRPAKYIPETGYDAELANKIRRMNSEKAYQEYMDLFTPEEPEKFLPQFQVFDTCTQIIDCITKCVSDPKNPEDVMEFSGDDPYDETRYGLKACQFYLEGGQKELLEASQRADICSRYEKNQDATAFYIKMDALDAAISKEEMPTKKFHRSGRLRHANF